MGNKWYRAYIAAFLILCTLGVLAMPFAGKDETSENRRLASFPPLVRDGRPNPSWPAAFEAWLDDHIGLRAHYAEAYAKALYRLGASADEQVIIGKDGWLYYAPTLPDYTGVGAPDEGERRQIRRMLEDVGRRLEAEGTRFAVLVAPNKNSIYPEYMPGAYPRAARSPYLPEERCGVPRIAVEEALRGRAEEGLYYKTDTHWNEKGARIAAALCIEQINALCGSEAPVPDPLAACMAAGEHTGDLAKMLFPIHTPTEPRAAYADDEERYQAVGRYKSNEDITIRTAGGAENLHVLVLRDSFCDALIPYLSNAFDKVCYSRAWPPVIDASENYDIVVLEIAERRLMELAESPIAILGASPPPETAKQSDGG